MSDGDIITSTKLTKDDDKIKALNSLLSYHHPLLACRIRSRKKYDLKKTFVIFNTTLHLGTNQIDLISS